MRARALFSVIFLLGSVFCPVSAREILDTRNASWSAVLSGSVIAEPALTSYGFCIATDARTVTSMTGAGKIIWEKSFSRSKNVAIASLPSDFLLFFDNDKKNMRLINPSGGIVWEKSTGLKIESASQIFPGRDGRFFIASMDEIQCWGMNGVCRWKLTSLSLKKIGPSELPDGSVVFFTAETDGNTGGLRISPFGQVMEEITFSGEVVGAWQCDAGILLSFKDGTGGLFSLAADSGRAENKWVFDTKFPGITFAVSGSLDCVCAIVPSASGLTVFVIDGRTGHSTANFSVSGISIGGLAKCVLNSAGLFLADSKVCALYRTDGTLIFEGELEKQKSKSAPSYIFLTDDGNLLLCRRNWTIDAFRIAQVPANPGRQPGKSGLAYPDFVTINTVQFDYLDGAFESSMTDPGRISGLQGGFYGEKEAVWASDALSVAYAYSASLGRTSLGAHEGNLVFAEDAPGLERIILQIPFFATSDSADCLSAIIRRTNDPTILHAVLKGIAGCGYDPDGKMLSALEERASRTDRKSLVSIERICDAVVSVCAYMGSPAYFSKGRGILIKFMSPNYDARTRDYARNALKKIGGI